MIFKDKLSNGMRVVGETMENYRSVSVSVWIRAGSVYENEDERGVSHFIEHMLFKGTEKRSAGDIAEEIDAVGGNLNAFTSKECTCFYVKVLDENLPKAIEILADLICNSKLDNADIEREKGVILEEISMNEDSPEDLAHETLCQTFYEGDPLASPVLGTAKSVASFTRDTLVNYMSRLYRPENMVIAIAGHFNIDEFMNAAEVFFRFRSDDAKQKEANAKASDESSSGSVKASDENSSGSVKSGDESNSGSAKSADVSYGRPAGGKKLRLIEKDIEQTHICFAFNGFPSESEGQYPLYMFNNAIGGSMSSRLFQSVREEKGMAYSVYSTPAFYSTTGYFTLYAGTGEKQTVEVAKLMLEEYRKIKDSGIEKSELERGKNQLKSGYVMGRESTSAHASSIGRAEILGLAELSEEQIIAKINSVSTEAVRKILPTVCDFDNMTAIFVGRVEKYRSQLEELILSDNR